MVAADGDRQRAGGADLADRGFRLLVVPDMVGGIAGHVSDVDDAHVLAAEDRAANVEIIAVERLADALGGASHCSRRVGLVVDQLVDRVGIAIGHADDGHVGLQRVEILDQRKVHECLEDIARRGCEFGHEVSSVLKGVVQPARRAARCGWSLCSSPREIAATRAVRPQ